MDVKIQVIYKFFQETCSLTSSFFNEDDHSSNIPCCLLWLSNIPIYEMIDLGKIQIHII